MKQFGQEGASNLILSPHFDDAVFSLGGLIGKYPHATQVITIFGGTPLKAVSRHWDRMCGFKDSTIAMQKRAEENTAALGMLGVPSENSINLSYLDRQYRQTFSNKEKTALLADIKTIIARIPEKRINIFAPMQDYHEDHKITRDLLVELFAEPSTDKERMHLYLYQDMPYFYRFYLRQRIKNFFRSRIQIIASLKPKLQNFSREYIGMSEQDFERKITAEKAYTSQLRPKYFGFRSLPRKQRFLSVLQSILFKAGYPHTEIVYTLE